MTETFSLVINTAAAPDDLRAWLEGARPGDQAVYAAGIDLLRDAPGVALVKQWVSAGLVTAFHQRDPQSPRRWQYLVRRMPAGTPPTAEPAGAAEHPRVALQKAALLTLLRARSLKVNGNGLAGEIDCPSLGELASALALGRSDNGRSRAKYLLRKLVAARAIELLPCEPRQQRRLRLLAPAAPQK
jgi:hypothetical protein